MLNRPVVIVTVELTNAKRIAGAALGARSAFTAAEAEANYYAKMDIMPVAA